VYADGRLLVTLKGERIVPEFLAILEDYVASHYGVRADPAMPGASPAEPAAR
jgi:(E)-4-hydroxy-3-methylbut-2-enyl-diphosphate synthase